MQTKAKLWKAGPDESVVCQLCAHHCKLSEGETGLCGVRKNTQGVLYTLADKVAALSLDPIEKKPLFHFLPGTKTLSLGTMGCNFSCLFCQNHTLSQTPKQGGLITGDRMEPQALVSLARQHGTKSISYTYSEPTIFFELMEKTASQAADLRLLNIMVSNGFQSPQCLRGLKDVIHAANIDLKAFTDDFYRNICGGRLDPVLANLKSIKKMGWHLEVTTLLIPGLNDSDAEIRQMAGFIADELGPDVPWHLSGFFPTYKLLDRPPTPVETLNKAREIGQKAGLWFVYQGNRHGRGGEDTICPGCGRTVITRTGFQIKEMNLRGNACAHCGHRILGDCENS